jgi:hypothetical protein
MTTEPPEMSQRASTERDQVAGPHGGASWRLEEPGGGDAEAVEAALASDAARLSYGHHSFEYTKTSSADGDALLTLSHRADSRCEAEGRSCKFTWLNGLTSKRVVPAVEGVHDEATRARIEQERLRAVGRGFFADVARLIDHAERGPTSTGGSRPGHL